MSPRSLRLAVVLVPASCLLGAFTAPAGAQVPAPRTVTAIGYAQAEVAPKDRHSNSSIDAAVEEAESAALPLAIAAGRERATELASAAAMTLGALLAVTELDTGSRLYGPLGPVAGTFGPGRYCGRVPRFVSRRDAQGRLRRVRRGTRRVCASRRPFPRACRSRSRPADANPAVRTPDRAARASASRRARV